MAYIEGDAPLTVISHIGQCRACAKEVEELRRMAVLFGLAAQKKKVIGLWQARLPRAPQPSVDSQDSAGTSPRYKKWFSLGTDQWWPRKGFSQLALTLGTLLLMIGGGALFYQRGLQSSPVNNQPVQSGVPIVPEVAPPPENTKPELTAALVIEASRPDISPQRIIQLNSRPATAQAFVERIKSATGQKQADNFARYSTLYPDLVDVAVPEQIIVEKQTEIAPPIHLRQLIAEQLINGPNGLFSPAETYQDKSYVVGQSGDNYLVWGYNRSGVTALYFARSDDNGQTWSSATRIDARVGRIINPRLAIDEQGYLYVAWRNWYNVDGNIFYFARSTDQGQTWSRAVRIDHATGRATRPDLVVNDETGDLYLAWVRGDVNRAVYLTHSADGGQTWSSKIRAGHAGP